MEPPLLVLIYISQIGDREQVTCQRQTFGRGRADNPTTGDSREATGHRPQVTGKAKKKAKAKTKAKAGARTRAKAVNHSAAEPQPKFAADFREMHADQKPLAANEHERTFARKDEEIQH